MSKEESVLDPVLPIQFVQGLARAAALSGISVDEVLDSENIDLENLPGLPISKIAIIVNFLIAQSPFSTFFPILRIINDEAITEMLTISSTSKNLLDVKNCLMEHGPFSFFGIQFKYEIGKDRDFYIIESHQPESLSRLFMLEICAASFVRFLPTQFQALKPLKCVEFDFELTGNLVEYEMFFGCPVLFSQAENKIHLSKDIVEKEIQSYSPNLLSQAIKSLQEKTDILLSLQGIRFQVSQIIRRLVSEKITAIKNHASHEIKLDISIENVSKLLGLNVRSLQRKLKQEGGSFIKSKNQVLIDESKKWMDDGQSNLDLIAEVLSFSDRASFSKVFNKYEGMWPAQYKQRKYSIV